MATESPKLSESESLVSEAQARRDFLKKAGRFAAVTPPSVTLLLGTSLSSAAIAKSGGSRPGNGWGTRTTSTAALPVKPGRPLMVVPTTPAAGLTGARGPAILTSRVLGIYMMARAAVPRLLSLWEKASPLSRLTLSRSEPQPVHQRLDQTAQAVAPVLSGTVSMPALGGDAVDEALRPRRGNRMLAIRAASARRRLAVSVRSIPPGPVSRQARCFST